jgi:hypothetical protein
VRDESSSVGRRLLCLMRESGLADEGVGRDEMACDKASASSGVCWSSFLGTKEGPRSLLFGSS